MWPVNSLPVKTSSFAGAGNASSSRPLPKFALGIIPGHVSDRLSLPLPAPCSVKEHVPVKERSIQPWGAIRVNLKSV